MADALLFWFLAVVTLGSGLAVVLLTNPIYCALSLAMTMIGVSAVFITLGAYFIAGVQLIVYAGAVLVLFVLVLMLFDLKSELNAFSKGIVSGAIKVGTVGILSGLISGAIIMTLGQRISVKSSEAAAAAGQPGFEDSSKILGKMLFQDNLFAFEALGVLLLVIAVGTVSLARSKGGTHAK